LTASSRPVASEPTDAELVAFVRDAIARGADRIQLRHAGEVSDHGIRTWPTGELGPGAIAAEAWRLAMREANALRGTQTFALVSYRPDAPVYDERCSFRCAGEETSNGLEGSERPTIAGVTGMLMRHSEANQRLAINSSLDIVRMYQRTIESRDAYIARLEAKHISVLTLVEDLQSTKFERDLTAARAARDDAMKGRVVGQLEKYIPVLAGKIFGEGLPELDELRNVVRSITDDEVKRLLDALAPERREPMFRVIKAMFDAEMAQQAAQQAQQKEAAAAAARATPNGAPPKGGPS